MSLTLAITDAHEGVLVDNCFFAAMEVAFKAADIQSPGLVEVEAGDKRAQRWREVTRDVMSGWVKGLEDDFKGHMQEAVDSLEGNGMVSSDVMLFLANVHEVTIHVIAQDACGGLFEVRSCVPDEGEQPQARSIFLQSVKAGGSCL